MKRSEIRGNGHRFDLAPGVRYAPPGLQKKKKIRRRNADRRKALRPCLTGTAAAPTLTLPRLRGREWEGAAHLSAFHRGSRPKESFIARDSAPGFCFLGRGLSVEWALPTPAYPSPARYRAPVIGPRG